MTNSLSRPSNRSVGLDAAAASSTSASSAALRDVVVDRRAVVRIDEREIPQLVALIDVGRPGRREMQRDARQRVRAPIGAMRATNRATSDEERRVVRGLENRRDERGRAPARTPRRRRSSYVRIFASRAALSA